CMQVLQTPHGF
nr:immunoglobulin light chain junction region [Macaca mulatta]